MDRISSLLPTGPIDMHLHRGARRHTARYPLNADVRVVSDVGVPLNEGTVLNASAGGMRVAFEAEVEEGDVLEIEVRFSRGHVGHERVEVVWSRAMPDGYVVGLRFV